MRTTLTALQELRKKSEKIAVLTCYDASFAALLEANGVDVLLVGDSLGMVLQGHETTLPVTLEEMAYHTACVARGSQRAFIVADMPFGTSQVSPEQTFEHAARLMAAGAPPVFGALIAATGYPLAFAVCGLFPLVAVPIVPVKTLPPGLETRARTLSFRRLRRWIAFRSGDWPDGTPRPGPLARRQRLRRRGKAATPPT